MTTNPAHDFTDLIDILADIKGERICVGDVLHVIERRSFGPVILVIGLVWLSPLTMAPGANWVVASVLLIIVAQLLVGLKHPWLPRGVHQASISRGAFEKVLRAARKPAAFFDRIARPRLLFLSGPQLAFGGLLTCVIACLIAYPLSLIPFASMLPGFAVVFTGVGMTARDGLFLLAGGALMAGFLGIGAWLLF